MRKYVEHDYLVVPINKKSTVIEDITCCESLEVLKTRINGGLFPSVVGIHQVGVSIITPPGVTKGVLEEGYNLGIRNFFLQPGTYDDSVDDFVRDTMKDALVVKGCVLVELG